MTSSLVPRAPLTPRVLVCIQDVFSSIRTTGHLESCSIGTLRCWTVHQVREVLSDWGPGLGAAVLDAASKDGRSALELIRAALPSLPVITREPIDGADTFSFASPTSDPLAMRVMDALLHIPDEDDPILFCGPDDSYGFMSTTARFDVDLDGRRWRSVEHYYQAQKFAGHPEEELVRATKSVREASRLGRTLPELRNDWASVRDGVMTKALRAKFTQDADLRRRLLGTGSRALVLHSAENNYWGDGGDGSGQNRLGELLMQVRAELLEALAQESGAIRFYRVNEPYGFMSNFAKYPVDLDGKRWPTSEHYFQAQKFAGSPEEEHIRSVTSADEAARLGRRLPGLRPDWEAVKDDVMLKALRAKFVQHATLRRQLLETGDRELVEHTRNDSYWADGGDGSGRNRLGELLMQVRQELREGGGT